MPKGPARRDSSGEPFDDEDPSVLIDVTDAGPNITSSALTLIRKRKSTGHSTSLPSSLSVKITSHICSHDKRGPS